MLIIVSAVIGCFLFFVPILWLLVPSIIGLWVYWDIAPRRFGRSVVCLLLIALLVRVLFSLGNEVFAYVIHDTNRPWDLAPDASVYNSYGYYIAEVLMGRTSPPLYKVFVHRTEHGGILPSWDFYQVTGMAYFNAVVFSLFGTTPLSIKLFNSLLSVLTAFLLYRYSRERMGEQAAIAGMALVLFYPSLVLWSVTGLRESPLIFLCTVALLVAGRLSSSNVSRVRSLPAALILLLSLVLVYFLRSGVAYVLTLILLMTFALRLFVIAWSGRSHLVKGSLTCVAVGSILLGIHQSSSVRDYVDDFGVRSTMRAVSNYRVELSATGYKIYPERYYQYFDYFSKVEDRETLTLSVWEKYLVGLKAVSRFYFSPFMSDLYRGSRLFFLYPQAIFNIVLFPFVLLGSLWCIERHPFFFLPMVLFVFVGGLAIGLHGGNVGTIFRYKDMVAPYYLLLGAVGVFAICRQVGFHSPEASQKACV